MKHFKLALPWQILIGLVLGCLFGYFLYGYAHYIQWAGDIFLRALKMIIIPMVFTSLVVGVASIQSSADLGRIAGKTFLYYVCNTVIAIIIGLLLVNFFQTRSWGKSSAPDSRFKRGWKTHDYSLRPSHP